MLITMPSGQPVGVPPVLEGWADQAGTSTGTPIGSMALEYFISSAVQFHRRRPLFQGVATSEQAVPSATWTPIDLGEIVDTYGGHDDLANPSRVAGIPNTIPDQWYLCTGYVPFGAAPGSAAVAGVRVGGGTVMEGAKLPSGAGHATDMMVVDLLRIPQETASGIELMGYQRSGAPLSTVIGQKAPSLTLRWACADSGTTVALPGTPRTWTADDLLTADSTGPGEVPFNVHVRDTLRWLWYPPVARLDSAGTTQQIPPGAWTSVEMTTSTVDTYGGHTLGSTRYTCQRDGLYFVYGLAAMDDGASPIGHRVSRLIVNGSRVYGGTSCNPDPSGSIGSALPACAHIRLEAGDYVEVQAWQTNGNNRPVKAGPGDASKLICVWVRR